MGDANARERFSTILLAVFAGIAWRWASGSTCTRNCGELLTCTPRWPRGSVNSDAYVSPNPNSRTLNR